MSPPGETAIAFLPGTSPGLTPEPLAKPAGLHMDRMDVGPRTGRLSALTQHSAPGISLRNPARVPPLPRLPVSPSPHPPVPPSPPQGAASVALAPIQSRSNPSRCNPLSFRRTGPIVRRAPRRRRFRRTGAARAYPRAKDAKPNPSPQLHPPAGAGSSQFIASRCVRLDNCRMTCPSGSPANWQLTTGNSFPSAPHLVPASFPIDALDAWRPIQPNHNRLSPHALQLSESRNPVQHPRRRPRNVAFIGPAAGLMAKWRKLIRGRDLYTRRQPRRFPLLHPPARPGVAFKS
jgi:hypothetical protein